MLKSQDIQVITDQVKQNKKTTTKNEHQVKGKISLFIRATTTKKTKTINKSKQITTTKRSNNIFCMKHVQCNDFPLSPFPVRTENSQGLFYKTIKNQLVMHIKA